MFERIKDIKPAMHKAVQQTDQDLNGFQPITRRQILDSSKLKEFADDNFKFDKNSRKLSKRVENTVGKGEIARYEQFLLFPQCFQKACFPRVSNGVIVWEWVKPFFHTYRYFIRHIKSRALNYLTHFHKRGKNHNDDSLYLPHCFICLSIHFFTLP